MAVHADILGNWHYRGRDHASRPFCPELATTDNHKSTLCMACYCNISDPDGPNIKGRTIFFFRTEAELCCFSGVRNRKWNIRDHAVRRGLQLREKDNTKIPGRPTSCGGNMSWLQFLLPIFYDDSCPILEPVCFTQECPRRSPAIPHSRVTDPHLGINFLVYFIRKNQRYMDHMFASWYRGLETGKCDRATATSSVLIPATARCGVWSRDSKRSLISLSELKYHFSLDFARLLHSCLGDKCSKNFDLVGELVW